MIPPRPAKKCANAADDANDDDRKMRNAAPVRRHWQCPRAQGHFSGTAPAYELRASHRSFFSISEPKSNNTFFRAFFKANLSSSWGYAMITASSTLLSFTTWPDIVWLLCPPLPGSQATRGLPPRVRRVWEWWLVPSVR